MNLEFQQVTNTKTKQVVAATKQVIAAPGAAAYMAAVFLAAAPAATAFMATVTEAPAPVAAVLMANIISCVAVVSHSRFQIDCQYSPILDFRIAVDFMSPRQNTTKCSNEEKK